MPYLDASTAPLMALCATYLRLPTLTYDVATDTTTFTFAPPLTTAEQATFTDLQQMAGLGLQTLTLAQYQARKADVQGLRDYMALANPTAAQTTAAFKALVRVVGAMLKLGLG